MDDGPAAAGKQGAIIQLQPQPLPSSSTADSSTGLMPAASEVFGQPGRGVAASGTRAHAQPDLPADSRPGLPRSRLGVAAAGSGAGTAEPAEEGPAFAQLQPPAGCWGRICWAVCLPWCACCFQAPPEQKSSPATAAWASAPAQRATDLSSAPHVHRRSWRGHVAKVECKFDGESSSPALAAAGTSRWQSQW